MVSYVMSCIYFCVPADFGVDELLCFNDETNFPWLMSNVIDKETNRALAGGKVKKILEWEGKKVGYQYVCGLHLGWPWT